MECIFREIVKFGAGDVFIVLKKQGGGYYNLCRIFCCLLGIANFAYIRNAMIYVC